MMKNVDQWGPNYATGCFTIEMSNINDVSASSGLFKFVFYNLRGLNSGCSLLSELCDDEKCGGDCSARILAYK